MEKVIQGAFDVRLRDGAIVITVPFGAVVHGLRHSDYGYQLEEYDGQPIQISDEAGFSEDVALELLSEREDGSTLLSDIFDKASERAVEHGSEYVLESRRN